MGVKRWDAQGEPYEVDIGPARGGRRKDNKPAAAALAGQRAAAPAERLSRHRERPSVAADELKSTTLNQSAMVSVLITARAASIIK